MENGTFVELIVGGQPYTTTQETLTKYPESLFPELLTGGAPKINGTTCFLDRDGQLFRHVLNFLRTGKLCLPESFGENAQLRLEAEFYRLPELIRELDLQVNAEVIHVELQEHWLDWDCKNVANGPVHKLKYISPFKEFFQTEGKGILEVLEGQSHHGADTFHLGHGSLVRVEWARKLESNGWKFRNQTTAGLGNTDSWLYCTTDCWTYKTPPVVVRTTNGHC